MMIYSNLIMAIHQLKDTVLYSCWPLQYSAGFIKIDPLWSSSEELGPRQWGRKRSWKLVDLRWCKAAQVGGSTTRKGGAKGTPRHDQVTCCPNWAQIAQKSNLKRSTNQQDDMRILMKWSIWYYLILFLIIILLDSTRIRPAALIFELLGRAAASQEEGGADPAGQLGAEFDKAQLGTTAAWHRSKWQGIQAERFRSQQLELFVKDHW